MSWPIAFIVGVLALTLFERPGGQGTSVVTENALLMDGLGKDTHEAIVVGTGFGGAVAACRLAEAGVDVAVIERGARVPLGGFPRHLVRADLMLSHHGGPYDVRPLNDVLVVQAAGYGGGSLIYTNVQMRPPPQAFAEGWTGMSALAGRLPTEPEDEASPRVRQHVSV